MHEWAFKKWITLVKFDVVTLLNGFFLVKLYVEEAMIKVLWGGPWMFGQRAIFLRCWMANFNPKEKSITSIIVWVHLSGLPPQYWDDEILLGIGN